MKIPWSSLFLTVGLYVLLQVAFLIGDHFSYRQGANDMGNGLLVFAIGVLIIAGFFIHSIYQAIAKDSSYWLVVGLHLICAALFVWLFMR